MVRRPFILAAAVALCLAAPVAAEDVFYDVAIGFLDLAPAALPAGPAKSPADAFSRERPRSLKPYAVLDGPGEAYLTMREMFQRWADFKEWKSAGRVAIRMPAGKPPTGRLFLPNADDSELMAFRFSLPAAGAPNATDAKSRFYKAKERYYRDLLARNIPGAAWFRYQAKLAVAQVNSDSRDDEETRQRLPNRNSGRDLENTFALFSGSRAVSENLQLDRALQLRPGEAPDVEIDKLDGITVKEIDWQPLIKDLKPGLDPLAGAIPADQHAVFFASFQALVAVADEINRQGTPLARFVDSRSEDELVKDRYERQLGLPLSLLARLLGGQVIDSVALTGSDPYFFAGTDVALVFEAKQPAVLKALLLARVAAAVKDEEQVKPVQGQLEGVSYAGFVSPDRRVSSYVAELGKAVVVTNSTAQLAQLAKVRQGKTAAIASLPEYAFFRARYPRGEGDESALVFLSDATIRRWCGPRWRIADSRRVRAAAALAALQAEQMDKLAADNVEPGPIHVERPLAGLGDLRLSSDGVHASVMGSLEFLTPIVEMQIERATAAEADAYRRWRNQYQSNWRWAFDPIALQLVVKDHRLAADLSVMPLIWGSEYRTWVDVALGAEIKPGAGDPHDAPAHFVMAVNRKSQTMGGWDAILESSMKCKISLTSWLGESVAWYIDDDPVWKELAAIDDSHEAEQFFGKAPSRFPAALYCEVASAEKLTLFMAGVRGLLEDLLPEMTTWETLKHNDQPYVRIGPTERGRGIFPFTAELNIYYAFWSDALVVTLNENVLKRALDRRAAREEAEAAGREPPAPSKAWLGSSMALQFDGKAIEQISRLGSGDFQQILQFRSWGNLPILNEWRRRYPDRDPVELHERCWHTRLVCPGGGEYVWNDEWQTMESTAFGHPGEPKQPATLATPWQSILGGNLGLTFEQEGLRAKAVLDREAP